MDERRRKVLVLRAAARAAVRAVSAVVVLIPKDEGERFAEELTSHIGFSYVRLAEIGFLVGRVIHEMNDLMKFDVWYFVKSEDLDDDERRLVQQTFWRALGGVATRGQVIFTTRPNATEEMLRELKRHYLAGSIT